MIVRWKNLFSAATGFCCLLCALLIGGCGGSGGGGALPPPPPVAVVNTFAVDLTAADVPGGSTDTGMASATVRHNITDSTIEASVTLTGISADSVSLVRGHAGQTGDEVYALVQDVNAAQWSLDSNAISANDAADLEIGGMHLSVSTAAHPAGALRGQLLPQGVAVLRFELTPEQVAPGSDSAAAGVAWITLDDNNSTMTAHVAANGLADADSGIIGRALAGSDGSVLATLVQDSVDKSHWFYDTTGASADLRQAIAAAELHVSLTTPTMPGGQFGASIFRAAWSSSLPN